MTRRGNNGGEATADTSGESLGSELALRADDASVSVSRFTSSCQGRVLADPGQPPDGGKLLPKEALTRSVRFLGSSPSVARLLALAVPGDEMRSRLSEPQASEAIPQMPTIETQR